MTYQPPQTPPGPPYQPAAAPPPPHQPRPKRPTRRTRKVVAIVAAGFLLIIAVGTVINLTKSDPFGDVQKECGYSGITVADGGDTLLINGKGDDDLIGANIDTVTCALDTLEMPTSVRSELFTTRALDGRQQGTWDGFAASWSYHPDSGLNLVVTRT